VPHGRRAFPDGSCFDKSSQRPLPSPGFSFLLFLALHWAHNEHAKATRERERERERERMAGLPDYVSLNTASLVDAFRSIHCLTGHGARNNYKLLNLTEFIRQPCVKGRIGREREKPDGMLHGWLLCFTWLLSFSSLSSSCVGAILTRQELT
jgi:hypothetical protein